MIQSLAREMVALKAEVKRLAKELEEAKSSGFTVQNLTVIDSPVTVGVATAVFSQGSGAITTGSCVAAITMSGATSTSINIDTGPQFTGCTFSQPHPALPSLTQGVHTAPKRLRLEE